MMFNLYANSTYVCMQKNKAAIYTCSNDSITQCTSFILYDVEEQLIYTIAYLA